MIRVLFVCTGNICRSPTAEGVFRNLVAEAGLADRIVTDSVGTHDYHVGEPPDSRAIEAAARRGVDICDLRARKLNRRDLDDFDLILVMDEGHRRLVAAQAPSAARGKVHLFLEATPEAGRSDVPDPYYGGAEGFEYALDLIETAGRAWLERIRRESL